MVDLTGGHLEDLRVDHWADHSGGHLEGRMEGHLEDLMVDRTVVWEPPWAGRVVGMMLVVPGWFLSLPTPASTV